MTTLEPACFGFYFGSSHPTCQSCAASRRCKAVLISDGFTIMGNIVDQMARELPTAKFRDTDRISEIVKQMKDPPGANLSKEEAELLGLTASDKELGQLDI